MKQDVLDALSGRFPRKIPSKETLNHPGIINLVSGLDVYEDTPGSFDIAWRRLGIDVHVPLMTENAVRPGVPGGTWEADGRVYSDYGVYPTSMPLHLPGSPNLQAEEQVFSYDPRQDEFDLAEAIRDFRASNQAFRTHFGDLAVMYDLYYTTLFMWPVMTFEWMPFMLAAASDPTRFDECLWTPWVSISRKHFEVLAAGDEEVVFCHDDLAMGDGPVFSPAFLEKYIFSRYAWIMEPVFEAGSAASRRPFLPTAHRKRSGGTPARSSSAGVSTWVLSSAPAAACQGRSPSKIGWSISGRAVKWVVMQIFRKGLL